MHELSFGAKTGKNERNAGEMAVSRRLSRHGGQGNRRFMADI